MNLIILTSDDRLDGNLYSVKDHRARHIHSVLKVGPGDKVGVGLLNGPLGAAVIRHLGAEEVVLECDSWVSLPDPAATIDLICALPRPQTLKKVLTTAAMMCVRRVHLVRAHRVEKSYFQSPVLLPHNYTRHLIDGLSQAKLTRLPEVHIHRRFRVFFEDTLGQLEDSELSPATRLLPDPDAESGLGEVLNAQSNRLLLAFGPEGGWIPFEFELMRETGFAAFSLGGWILRTETAITAALAQVELMRHLGSTSDGHRKGT